MVREHGSPFLFGHRNGPDLVKTSDATNAETRLAYSFYNQGPDPTQLPIEANGEFPINSIKHAAERWSEQAPYRIEVWQ